MTEIIHIDKLIHRGLGLGRRPNGQAVFVPFSAPGEDVRVRVRTEHKSYAEAELLDVLSPSPDRRTPPCPYFGRCGGCQLMHLAYPCQTLWKAPKNFGPTAHRLREAAGTVRNSNTGTGSASRWRPT